VVPPLFAELDSLGMANVIFHTEDLPAEVTKEWTIRTALGTELLVTA
jgi:hypothetical protein